MLLAFLVITLVLVVGSSRISAISLLLFVFLNIAAPVLDAVTAIIITRGAVGIEQSGRVINQIRASWWAKNSDELKSGEVTAGRHCRRVLPSLEIPHD